MPHTCHPVYLRHLFSNGTTHATRRCRECGKLADRRTYVPHDECPLTVETLPVWRDDRERVATLDPRDATLLDEANPDGFLSAPSEVAASEDGWPVSVDEMTNDDCLALIRQTCEG